MEEVDPESSGNKESTGGISGSQVESGSQYESHYDSQLNQPAGSEARLEGHAGRQDPNGQGYQGYAPPYGQPGYGPSQYNAYPGAPSSAYYGYQGSGPGFPGYGPPMYGPGYYPPTHVAQPTSGLAIASLCCSVGGVLIFFIWPLTAIVGIILGFMALSHIDRSGGAVSGRGLAIAGIVAGFFIVAMTIIMIVVIASVASSCHTNTYGHLICH